MDFSCKEIIENQHGIINKYLGDGFLGYWPEADTSPDEIMAVISALKELQRQEGPAFRFVVHFGPVAMGEIASMGEESLIGGEVNLIFRLEKLASSLGESCCLSETAHTKLHELVKTRSLRGNARSLLFRLEPAIQNFSIPVSAMLASTPSSPRNPLL